MALISDPITGASLAIGETSKAARVTLYGPDGTPLVSQMRGGAKNLRTDGGLEERDGVALLLPGTAGSRIGGTATDPIRTDPTGTTAQPVSGTVSLAAGAAVLVGNGAGAPVPVAFVGRQPVDVLFPNSQAVSFGGTAQPVTFPSAQPVTFPSAQPVSGNVNAGLRVGGTDVSGSNPVPTTTSLLLGSTPVDGSTPLPVSVIDAPAPLGFVAVIDVAPATTLVSGTVYWALRNGGTRTVCIRRFDLQQGFVGTAAASRSSYEVVRFTAGTPSGGTAVPPARKVSSSAASGATILTAAAGLTMTGAAYDGGAVHRVASANQLAATTTQDVVFTDELTLAPGEGLVVRANGAVVAGSFLVGSLGWYER